MGRGAEAVNAYRAVAARYPNRDVAGDALWHSGLTAYAAGNLRVAEQAWSRLTEIPGGVAHRMKALYWTGRLQEATAGVPAAEPFYQRVQREAQHFAGNPGPLTSRHAVIDEPFDDVKENRREENPEQRNAEHAAEHRNAQEPAHLRAGAAADQQRYRAEDERKRRHQDRPQPEPARLQRRLMPR